MCSLQESKIRLLHMVSIMTAGLGLINTPLLQLCGLKSVVGRHDWIFLHKSRACCRGYTPLDVCALEMEYQRDCADARLSGFRCHEDRYMQVIQHLQNGDGKGSLKSTLPYPRSKEGCTCGRCLQGFLSPRMLLR